MTNQTALTKSEAFELLAFLVMSARGLLEEPQDYGPRRLLRAGQKLAHFMVPRVDEESREFLEQLCDLIGRLFPLPENEEQLATTLDVCAQMVARELRRQTLR